MFINDTFVGSTLVALDRTVSLSHNLPSSGGNFTLYAYDINHDGMLLSGDSYPASTERLKEGEECPLFVFCLTSPPPST